VLVWPIMFGELLLMSSFAYYVTAVGLYATVAVFQLCNKRRQSVAQGEGRAGSTNLWLVNSQTRRLVDRIILKLKMLAGEF